MKKIYLMASAALLSISAMNAQIYGDNFDLPIDEFVDGGTFITGQNGSDLIIFSQGHDEWTVVNYDLSDEGSAINYAMTSSDTIYVRARADFEGTVNPILNIGLVDNQGISPNNNEYNAVNSLTLDTDWKVLKYVVPNWNMTFGDAQDPNLGSDADSNNIATITLGPNTAFASFPSLNSEGQTVNAAFNGTIYIDYISIGTDLVAGEELNVFTSYNHSFTQSSLNDLTSAASFDNTIVNDALVITSQGHDQWETINIPVTDGVVDISSGLLLSFEVSSSVASTTTDPIGFMIAAVDEVGTRIQYDGLFTVQGLTTTPTVVSVDFNDRYESVTEVTVPVNPKRIASFEVLINQGFASAFASTNDLGQTVNAAYEGVITISGLQLDTDVLSNTNSKVEKLSLNAFPNPASDIINIENANLNNAEFVITNLVGTQVNSGSIVNSSLDISSLSAGTYVLSVTKENAVYTSMITKK